MNRDEGWEARGLLLPSGLRDQGGASIERFHQENFVQAVCQPAGGRYWTCFIFVAFLVLADPLSKISANSEGGEKGGGERGRGEEGT